jgi:hypothetical protein
MKLQNIKLDIRRSRDCKYDRDSSSLSRARHATRGNSFLDSSTTLH